MVESLVEEWKDLKNQVEQICEEKDENSAIFILRRLKEKQMTMDILQNIRIGKTVNRMRVHFSGNNEIIGLVKSIINKWRSVAFESKKKAQNSNAKIPLKLAGGDDKRQKMIKNLIEYIGQKQFEEQKEPQYLAQEIEDELWNSFGKDIGEYNKRMRTITYNLKDPKNPELNSRLLNGIISPRRLAHMQSKDMMSDALKSSINKMADSNFEALRSDWNQANNKKETGMFSCEKCKKNRTTYMQIQIRGADEPMTTFVECLECGTRWSFN